MNRRRVDALRRVLAHPGQGWRQSAACASVGGEWWFPDVGDSTVAAKRVCAGCPVREPCLAEALDRDERWGVWGGLSPRERHQLRQDRRAA